MLLGPRLSARLLRKLALLLWLLRLQLEVGKKNMRVRKRLTRKLRSRG